MGHASMSDEHIDFTDGPDFQAGAIRHARGSRFLGIYFACCNVYGRVYVNRSGTAYEGRCPRCLRHLRIGIDPQGTSDRFFTAY